MCDVDGILSFIPILIQTVGFQLTDFVTDTMHAVMDLDATLAAHPVVQDAETPAEITDLFDSITCAKGASVIRMLANYVGEDTFKKALASYLASHKYGSAVIDDLWDEIEKDGATEVVK